MKLSTVFGFMLIILAAALGLYVGGYLMLFGGIVQLINGIIALSAVSIAIGAIKIMFASFAGWVTFVIVSLVASTLL
jgi:hypothetical protein